MLKIHNTANHHHQIIGRISEYWLTIVCSCFLVLNLSLCCMVQKGYAEESSLESSQVKIVGGTTASKDSWPWMAALLWSDVSNLYYAQFCGGTLIAKKWVLTAAHCVYNGSSLRSASEIDVAMGVHDLTTDKGDRISVKRIVPYSGYNSSTNDGDLALLELSRESSQQTLPLFSDASNSLTGVTGTLIGWGNQSSYYTDYAEELQQVEVPVISNSVCNSSYPGQVTSNMICAGYSQGGKDSCQGDSGGPLMVYYNNSWRQAGIISWGTGCALAGYYGVNTRISEYVSFINSYINPSLTPVYLLLLKDH